MKKIARTTEAFDFPPNPSDEQVGDILKKQVASLLQHLVSDVVKEEMVFPIVITLDLDFDTLDPWLTIKAIAESGRNG